MHSIEYDLAIIGGGLAGGLAALALGALRPELRVLLIERDVEPGGNHIWSFFDGDVAPQDRWLVDPMIAHRWAQGHAVAAQLAAAAAQRAATARRRQG